MALPLTEYLNPGGSYLGFDVVDRSVAWCRRNISERHPNFTFHHMDVFNRRYNPAGTVKASSYTFPLEDRSLDFVFLTSVFTHMFPEDSRRYLHEIARLLRPGGRLLATFFLLNESQERRRAGSLNQIDFRFPGDGYRTRDEAVPESAIAVQEETVRDLFAGAGLELRDPIRFGVWSGRVEGLSLQDILLAVAPGQPTADGG